MGNVVRVLFVCMGNICRSPAAEGVFRHLIQEAGLHESIECESAGTIDYHEGSAPDKRVRMTGDERGFDISGRARQVRETDLSTFDLILAMDRENLDYVRSLDGRGHYGEKIQLFCDFVTESGADEVPDPYYGGQEGFDRVFDLLEDGCAKLLLEVRTRLSVSG